MSSTGVRKPQSIQERAIAASTEAYKQLMESYKPFSADSGLGSLSQGGGGSGNSIISGNYLPIPGGTMTGLLSFQPIAKFLSSDILDLTDIDDRTNRIIITGESSANDDLKFINIPSPSASTPIFLQGVVGIDIQLIHDAASPPDSNHKKLRIPGGSDVTLTANDNVILIYDTVSDAFAVLGAPAISSAAGDNLGNHIATMDIEMSTHTIRFDNNVVGLAWDTNPTGNNVEISVNTANQFDFTRDDDATPLIVLRAQDTINGDISSSWSQTPYNGVSSITTFTFPHVYEIDRGADRMLSFPDNSSLIIFPDGIDFGFTNPSTGTVNMGELNSLVFTNFGTVGKAISKFSTGMHYDLEDITHMHVFRVNGATPLDQLTISASAINVHGNGLTNYVGWTAGVGQALAIDGSGATFDLPTGDIYTFSINAVDVLVIAGGASPAIAVGGDITMGENFIQLDDLTDASVTTPGTNKRRIYFSSTQGAIVAKDSSGTVHNLETGGSGASFPLDYPVDRQGNKTGTVTHDLSATSAHKLVFTATGDCDITLSNIPTSAADAIDFYIEIIDNGSGGHIITFNDSAVLNPPTIVTVANTTSLVSCHADGDGNVRVITLLNASPSSGNFATQQLNNLSSPVLNVAIDFNSKAPTNFSGFTTGVGQSLAVDGSGFTHNLPTGDAYLYRINGADVLTITAAGLGMNNNISMGENYMTFDDISTPANPGIGQRRLFVDTATGELSVRTNGGITVSLEGAASTSFIDSTFDIHDETTTTKKLVFALENMFAGTHFITAVTTSSAKTWTLPDITGELLSTQGSQNIGGVKTFNNNAIFNFNVDIGSDSADTLTIAALIDSNVNPHADGVYELGSSSLNWDDVFSETFTIRGTGGKSGSGTERYITADAQQMLFNVPSGDGYLFRQNDASTLFEVEQDGTINAHGDLVFASAGDTIDFNSAQSGVGSAGAADSLPASPDKYIIIKQGATEYVIPAFAKA